MTVKELSVADYRNIEKINITPSESVNVITEKTLREKPICLRVYGSLRAARVSVQKETGSL